MTAVGLGQQGSQAVGSVFESLPCQIFLRFIPNIFRYPKLVTHIKGFRYENFRHCETKIFRRKILILPHPPLIHKLFRYPKLMKH